MLSRHSLQQLVTSQPELEGMDAVAVTRQYGNKQQRETIL